MLLIVSGYQQAEAQAQQALGLGLGVLGGYYWLEGDDFEEVDASHTRVRLTHSNWEAFGDLATRFEPMVYAIALRRLGTPADIAASLHASGIETVPAGVARRTYGGTKCLPRPFCIASTYTRAPRLAIDRAVVAIFGNCAATRSAMETAQARDWS